jgi:RHS repeat-associated protein
MGFCLPLSPQARQAGDPPGDPMHMSSPLFKNLQTTMDALGYDDTLSWSTQTTSAPDTNLVHYPRLMYYYHASTSLSAGPDYLGHVEYITDLDGVPYQYFWYSPLGETLIEEKATRPGMHFDSPYRFNAKELDEETGLYYYGARYYNPMVSVWLGVDRLSAKYPALSPFNFSGNNPILFVDPNGDSLDVANQISGQWLLLIVSEKNRDRVSIEDGKVSINTDGLSKKQLKEDKGLNLINKMVSAEEKYLFEVGDVAYMKNSEGQMQAYRIYSDRNGIMNASDGGTDSNNSFTHLPSDGYNGQVSMAMSGSWVNGNGKDMIKSVIFHELAENYFRTSECIDYRGNKSNGGFGAHYRAAQWEGNHFGNSSPGAAGYNEPKLNPRDRILLFYIQKTFNNGK